MREFGAHPLRREGFLKKARKQPDIAGQDQIMQRPGVGDDKPHGGSKAEAPQVDPIPDKIVFAKMSRNPARKQEHIEFATGSEAQIALQFRSGKMAEAKLLQRECFQGASLKVPRGSETRRQFVGDCDGQVHPSTLA